MQPLYEVNEIVVLLPCFFSFHVQGLPRCIASLGYKVSGLRAGTLQASVFFGGFIYFAFLGRTRSIWKFPGQGSDWSYSCLLNARATAVQDRAAFATYTISRSNAGSLTY